MTKRQSNQGRKVNILRWAAGALALGFAIVGCAGELDRSQDYDWAYADSQGGSGNSGDPQCLLTLISNQCLGCHSTALATAAGKGLDLESANLSQRLLNKASACGDPPIIDPSNKANSAFLQRVTGTAKGCSGMVMPPSGALMGAELKCVQDWINGL